MLTISFLVLNTIECPWTVKWGGWGQRPVLTLPFCLHSSLPGVHCYNHVYLWAQDTSDDSALFLCVSNTKEKVDQCKYTWSGSALRLGPRPVLPHTSRCVVASNMARPVRLSDLKVMGRGLEVQGYPWLRSRFVASLHVKSFVMGQKDWIMPWQGYSLSYCCQRHGYRFSQVSESYEVFKTSNPLESWDYRPYLALCSGRNQVQGFVHARQAFFFFYWDFFHSPVLYLVFLFTSYSKHGSQ